MSLKIPGTFTPIDKENRYMVVLAEWQPPRDREKTTWLESFFFQRGENLT